MEFNFYNPTKKEANTHKKRVQTDEFNESSSRKKTKGNMIERKARGSWTTDRDMTLLREYFRFRPHGVPYRNRTQQWNKVTKEVNKHTKYDGEDNQDKKNPSMAKKSVIERFKRLLEIYENIYKESKIKDDLEITQGDASIELLAYRAWRSYTEDDVKSKEMKEKQKIQLDKREDLREKARGGKMYHEEKERERKNQYKVPNTFNFLDHHQEAVNTGTSEENSESEVDLKQQLQEHLSQYSTTHKDLMVALSVQTARLTNIESILNDINSSFKQMIQRKNI